MAAADQENIKSLDINGNNEENLPLNKTDSKSKNQVKDDDKERRLEYLLKQTKLFAHFMSNGRVRDDKGQDKTSKSSKNNQRQKKRAKKHDGDGDDDDDDDKHDTIFSFTETPHFVTGEMRDYQIRGLNWLISLFENNINGILADEMGLGKTLQSISIIGYLYHFKKLRRPHLIVVPKSTLYNWIAEFKRWCPTCRTFAYFGSKEERGYLKRNLLDGKIWDVCITTYEMCLNDQLTLKRINWQYLIVDEGHRIKNEATQLARALRSLSSKNRLILTGTPLQNNLHELWSLLNFLLPDFFDSADDFDEWFDSDECLTDHGLVERLQHILKPFMLRRMKADVEKSLLPKKETKIFVGLAKLQREWYQKVLMKDIDKIINGSQVVKMSLQNILKHLQKCSSHPYLFNGAEPGPPYTTDEHLVNNCGKMVVMDKLLKRLKEQGHRVLLFSQMARMLDIFEDYCFLRKYEYCRLDGNTSFEDRAQAVDDFNAENSSKFIFMLTTRAGGLGLNLMTADTVIIYDSDWNPQADLQAMDRAHRIGQTKQVRVFRLITENTVDQKIVERAEVKLRLDKLVIQNGKGVVENNQLTKNEVQRIVNFGVNYILSSDQSDITDENIDQILDRAEKKTAEQNEELDKLGENQLRKFTFDVPETLSQASAYSLYQFEGTNYKELRKTDDLSSIMLPRRAKRAATKQPKQIEPKSVYKDFHFLPKKFYELYDDDNFYDGKGNMVSLLDEEELEQKKKLESQGFTNWSQTSFNKFISAMARFGRTDIENVSKNVPNKRPDEVIAYYKVFWERCKELENYDAIIKRIERADDMMKKKGEIRSALDWKMSTSQTPLEELNISALPSTSENKFELSHNRFILCKIHTIGLDKANLYYEIQMGLRTSPRFRFDLFSKAVTAEEIEKQANFLLRQIHMEYLRRKEYEKTIESKSITFAEYSQPTPNNNGTSLRVMQPAANASSIQSELPQIISNGSDTTLGQIKREPGALQKEIFETGSESISSTTLTSIKRKLDLSDDEFQIDSDNGTGSESSDSDSDEQERLNNSTKKFKLS